MASSIQRLKPPPGRSLAELFPTAASQWHSRKNGVLKAADVTAWTRLRVWWKCPKGRDHEWQASVGNRSRGQGCPSCRGLKVSTTNSLARRFPAVAGQWHPTRNGGLRPQDVVAGSHRRVWWKCLKGSDHEWQAAVVQRTSGYGCPFCRGTWVSRTNSLAARFPALARQWHPTRNGKLRPSGVVRGSYKLAWWKCPMGEDHVWRTPISQRTSGGYGCPFCSGRYPCASNNLARLRPDLARLWHPTKNSTLRPTDVLPGSPRAVWWKCDEGPDHEWKSSVQSAKNIKGCPFCTNRRVSITNCLATTHPRVAARWNRGKNRGLTARQVMRWSKRNVWWRCPHGPDHQWQALVASTVGTNASCPFCRNRRVSVTNSLATLYPKIAREWDRARNRVMTPATVLATADRPAWWRCPLGHGWRAPIRERTAHRRACPICASALPGTGGPERRRRR
jgi:Probable Zinc-ribbon domain